MIAFASRYGHQDLISITGEVSVDRVSRFCKALGYWIKSEHKNGSSMSNQMAEGG